jgi:hypothetical protein
LRFVTLRHERNTIRTGQMHKANWATLAASIDARILAQPRDHADVDGIGLGDLGQRLARGCPLATRVVQGPSGDNR